jgi:hypothetical protein
VEDLKLVSAGRQPTDFSLVVIHLRATPNPTFYPVGRAPDDADPQPQGILTLLEAGFDLVAGIWKDHSTCDVDSGRDRAYLHTPRLRRMGQCTAGNQVPVFDFEVELRLAPVRARGGTEPQYQQQLGDSSYACRCFPRSSHEHSRDSRRTAAESRRVPTPTDERGPIPRPYSKSGSRADPMQTE